YVAKSGTLSFAAGEYSKPVSVVVNCVTMQEGDERFFLNLSNPTNGTKILDGQGLAVIANDDPITLHTSAAQAGSSHAVTLGPGVTLQGFDLWGNPAKLSFSAGGIGVNGGAPHEDHYSHEEDMIASEVDYRAGKSER